MLAVVRSGQQSHPCTTRPPTRRPGDFCGHNAHVNSLDFSPDGKVFASAGDDAVVRLWDVATGGELRQLKGHDDTVVVLCAFAHDGKTIVTSGIDKTIRIWDIEGKELRRCTGHGAVVSEIAISRDGKVIASASWDQTVKLWDQATGKEAAAVGGTGTGGLCRSLVGRQTAGDRPQGG